MLASAEPSLKSIRNEIVAPKGARFLYISRPNSPRKIAKMAHLAVFSKRKYSLKSCMVSLHRKARFHPDRG